MSSVFEALDGRGRSSASLSASTIGTMLYPPIIVPSSSSRAPSRRAAPSPRPSRPPRTALHVRGLVDARRHAVRQQVDEEVLLAGGRHGEQVESCATCRRRAAWARCRARRARRRAPVRVGERRRARDPPARGRRAARRVRGERASGREASAAYLGEKGGGLDRLLLCKEQLPAGRPEQFGSKPSVVFPSGECSVEAPPAALAASGLCLASAAAGIGLWELRRARFAPAAFAPARPPPVARTRRAIYQTLQRDADVPIEFAANIGLLLLGVRRVVQLDAGFTPSSATRPARRADARLGRTPSLWKARSRRSSRTARASSSSPTQARRAT